MGPQEKLLLLLWGRSHLWHTGRESRGGHLSLLLLHDLLHRHWRVRLHGPHMWAVSHGLPETTHVASSTGHHGHSLLLLLLVVLLLHPMDIYHSLLLDPALHQHLPLIGRKCREVIALLWSH